MDENGLRRHAGLARVQPAPESDRPGRALQVGILPNDDKIGPGKFENARDVLFREEGEKTATVFRRPGEDDLVDPRPDGLLGRGGRFGQDLHEIAIDQAPLEQLLDQPAERRAATFGRLEQDGVAGHERLQELNAGEKKRIISRANNRGRRQTAGVPR